MAQRVKAQGATAGTAYQLVAVPGPSEGVDLRLSPTLLAPGRARALINWSLEEPGALVAAPGWLRFSTAALGASRLQGGARIYLNTALPSAASTIVTLVASAGGIYTQTDSGGWLSTTASRSGLISTNEIHFAHDRDLVAAFDGGSTWIWKSTNGSSWTRFGIARPATQVLSTLSTGGLSSGRYEVTYTFKDRDLAYESNGSTTASTITLSATSGAIQVVMANSTDPQVDAIVLYARQLTTFESVRRKVSSFVQSSAANSTAIITSTAWTTNDEEPSDHDLPVAASFAVVWKNRWWAVDATVTNRLHFTQLFLPQAWPALFFLDIPFRRGDAIRALQAIGDQLVIFGDSDVFTITGQTSLDFEVRPSLASQDGALGPRAVCLIENAVIHAGVMGVWSYDGVTDRFLSQDIEPAWQDLVALAATDALRRTACYYHFARKELRVAVARRYPSGMPGEWILDLNRSRDGATAWRASDHDIAGYIGWDGPESVAGNRGRVFSWPSTQSLLNEESTGYTANGAPQTCHYEGPGLTLGAWRGRWIDLRGEYEPHGGALTEQGVVDGVALPAQNLAIGSGVSVYGTATYGTATYAGSGRRQFVKLRSLSAAGRTYVQQLTYRGAEKFKLFGYALGVRPEPRSRDFSE